MYKFSGEGWGGGKKGKRVKYTKKAFQLIED